MSLVRAVVYTRVSTDRQAEDGISLDVQLELARRRCEERGWVLTEVYTDVMSGRSDRRPQLRRLEQDARAKRFDVVIVYKIDRLARSVSTFYRVAQLLKSNDIILVSLTEEVDLESVHGKAMVGMLAIFAEMFSGQLSERVRAAMRANASKGRHNGGLPPMGYHRVGGHLEIEPREAETVRAAFEIFLRTRSIRGTCVALNEMGLPTKRGGLWYTGGLKTILRNPVYFGMVAYGKHTVIHGENGTRVKLLDRSQWVTVDGAVPAIITRDEWEKAQSILDQNESKPSRVKYGQKLHTWSGMIYCAACGAVCLRYGSNKKGRTKAGEVRTYQSGAYICRTFTAKGKAMCPDYAYVSDAYLNRYALPAIASIVDQALEAAKRKVKPRTHKRQNRNEKRLAELQEKREREKELFRAGYSSFEEMVANIKRIDAQIAEIATISQSTPESISLKVPGKLMDLWPALSNSDRGELLRMLIERCEASGTAFTIHFKPFPFDGWPQEPVTIDRVHIQGPKRVR